MSSRALTSSGAGSAGQAPESRAPLTYLPALDGLRAVAIFGVVLYHANPGRLPGGFLGVDVFFVLSGYLITCLLLAEWQHRGKIDLPAFWQRRARRLLPALFLLLAAGLAFADLFLRDELAGLRSDALAALGYVTNWYLILGQQSYFETMGRPSLFQHLWSLAVEEQFYLVWPLLLAAGLRYLSRRRMLVLVLAGAAASAIGMALLYQPDQDPSRVYYGTDTRAVALLIGAALALARPPGQVAGRASRVQALGLYLMGLLALGALVAFYFQVDEFEPWLYEGGLTAVALTTAAAIAALVHPAATWSSRLLGAGPLRWVGQRSYSIYLWHWPILVLTRPQLDIAFDGWPLFFLQMALIVALAELSYRYVETPIRAGALGKMWERWRREDAGPRPYRLTRAAGLGAGLLALVLLGQSVVSAQPPGEPAYLSGETTLLSPSSSAISARPPDAGGPTSTPAPPAPTTNAEPRVDPTTAQAGSALGQAQEERPPQVSPPVSPTAASSARVPANAAGPRILALGDSVMLGAAVQLQHAMANITVDAAVGRQASAALALLRTRRDAGQLADVVVLHLGTNGPISERQFDAMMEVLGGERRVVWVNDKVPRAWEGPNNAMLARAVQRYPNAVLVDWAGVASQRPELFWGDGVHLRPEGARLYAATIAAGIEGQ